MTSALENVPQGNVQIFPAFRKTLQLPSSGLISLQCFRSSYNVYLAVGGDQDVEPVVNNLLVSSAGTKAVVKTFANAIDYREIDLS
jgi:hypothetical protein